MKKRKFFLVGFILLFLFVLVGTNNDLKFGSTKADNDYFGLYDHMKTEIDAKRPVIFSIPNHSTVCKGYAEYKVEYSYRNWQQKWVKKTATEKFFVVDDGWGSSFYRYFPNSLAQDKTKFGNTRFIIN